MPGDLLTGFVDWIMAAPECEWFVLGCMVGGFGMFSILTGYWIISDWIIRRIRRRW